MSKRILITGAGSGLGKGAALELARRGHLVIAAVHIMSQMTELKAEAALDGLSLTVERLDITDKSDRARASARPVLWSICCRGSGGAPRDERLGRCKFSDLGTNL